MGHCKSSAEEKVHSNTGIPQETRKKSNKLPNSTLKQLEKLEMKNPEISRRKQILRGRNKYKRNKGDHRKNQQSPKLVL